MGVSCFCVLTPARFAGGVLCTAGGAVVTIARCLLYAAYGWQGQ